MDKYISVEKLVQEVNKLSTSPLNEWDTLGVLELIKRQPSSDVEPVVHAHWIYERFGGMWPVGRERPEQKCSCCHGWSKFDSAYCPNCGAKMDKEETR